MRDVSLDLQRRAVRRAPVDTGNLRGSGSSRVERRGLTITGIVGFAAEYAVEQHERLDYNHPRGGEAKFLERPYLENKQRYIDYVQAALASEQ